MPNENCVREHKIKSFAFYVGACAFAVLVLVMLITLKKRLVLPGEILIEIACINKSPATHKPLVILHTHKEK